MEISANFKKKLLFYFILSMSIVCLDQFLKKYAISKIGLGNFSPFIPGFVQFNVVQNTGGAFSIFKEYPLVFTVIGLINVLILSWLIFCPTVIFNDIIRTGCACIFGGTIGNVIDRFLDGGVIDFFDLQFVNFAIFNVADVFIDIGVVLVLIGWYFIEKSNRRVGEPASRQ